MSDELEELLNTLVDEEGSLKPNYNNVENEDSEYISPMSLPVIYDEIKSDKEGDDDFSIDYKKVRNTYYGLIERGTKALEHSLKVATTTEHPRSLEVANSLMKNIADVAKQLIELQKNKNPSQNNKDNINNIGNVTSNNYNVIVNNNDLYDFLKEVDGNCVEIDSTEREIQNITGDKESSS